MNALREKMEQGKQFRKPRTAALRDLRVKEAPSFFSLPVNIAWNIPSERAVPITDRAK